MDLLSCAIAATTYIRPMKILRIFSARYMVTHVCIDLEISSWLDNTHLQFTDQMPTYKPA